jgi:hypothetical protein
MSLIEVFEEISQQVLSKKSLRLVFTGQNIDKPIDKDYCYKT